MKEKLELQAKKLKRASDTTRYREKLFKKLSGEGGVDIPINDNSNFIFSPEMSQNVEQFMAKEVSRGSVASYIFSESVRKHQQALRSGAKSVRHCPLTIRLGILIRSKMGYAGGLYDLLAEALGLPKSRTLQYYTVPTTNERDGVLLANLKKEKHAYDIRNPNADRFHWTRHCTLAFDSMTCKGRFVVNYHTGDIVGVDNECLKPDVIAEELKELNALEVNDESEAEPEMPPLAKHFLVFIATTWSPVDSRGKRCKHEMICARYSLKSITSDFLVPRIRSIILHLSLFGFICDTIVGDGASENRSLFKVLATITAKDILSPHYDAALLKELPINTKIAFYHPNPNYKHIKIFIGGEMPHWVKKFRNALDNKSRDLKFRGQRFSLAMLYVIWKEIGDGDVSGTNHLRNYKFGNEHFKLNSYNKMRVFLAVQIPSQTMIRMINDYCKPKAEGGCDGNLKQYGPMLEIFDKVDRLVDIINATRVKNGKDLKVEFINSPQHRHILELFSVLQLFEEWKSDAGGFTNHFITRQTYEDLKWMVFGLAGVACTYLNNDKSKQLNQSRSGSDVCEHCFAKLRQGSSNSTAAQLNQKLSKIAAQGADDSHLFQFKAAQNAGGKKREHESYFSKVHRSSKQKK
jgi:hypothetical protein